MNPERKGRLRTKKSGPGNVFLVGLAVWGILGFRGFSVLGLRGLSFRV